MSALLGLTLAINAWRSKPRARAERLSDTRSASPTAGLSVAMWGAKTFYENNYLPLVFHELKRDGHKIFVGSKKEPRLCRFCGLSPPDVSFQNEAHAIPQLIGNRTLIGLEECDECNRKASVYETDFGNFTHPDRSWAQVPGSGRVPKLKSASKKSHVEVTDGGVNIKLTEGDRFVDFDPNKQHFTTNTVRPTYRPLGVYKTLLKMALSILPKEELTSFGPALRWLAAEGLTKDSVQDATNFTCFTSFTGGPAPYPYPVVLLLKRRSDTFHCPFATFIVLFHNFSYQIFLPCQTKDMHLKRTRGTLPMWPHPFMLSPREHFVTRRAGPISLASSEPVRGQHHSIRMNFESAKRMPFS